MTFLFVGGEFDGQRRDVQKGVITTEGYICIEDGTTRATFFMRYGMSALQGLKRYKELIAEERRPVDGEAHRAELNATGSEGQLPRA